MDPRDEKVEDAFRRIESIAVPGRNRMKALSNRFENRDAIPLEVVLHGILTNSAAARLSEPSQILCGRSTVQTPDLNRQRQAGGLAFLPIVAPRDRLDDVLSFSFLRALREAPRIVPFDPVVRSLGGTFPVNIANEDATAPDLAVAIFDGGLPDNHGLDKWVTLHDAPGVGSPVEAAQQHGLAVTSAFLFGPLSRGSAALSSICQCRSLARIW